MEERFQFAGEHGFLTVREEGGQAILCGELQENRRGLYKGWLQGAAGARFLLGTFLPEKGRLCLRRKVPVSELKRRGVWPVTGAEAQLAFTAGEGSSPVRGGESIPTGWEWTEHLARYLGDPLLKKSAAQIKSALIRPFEGGVQIALPFSTKEALGLTPLFCFMELKCLGKRYYVRFQVDKRGWPVYIKHS